MSAVRSSSLIMLVGAYAYSVQLRDGLIVICSAGNVGVNPATGEPGYAGVTSPGLKVTSFIAKNGSRATP